MGFHNELFPTKIGYGTRGGFSWGAIIHELDSGAEQRIQRKSIFRKVYDVSIGIRDIADLSTMRHFVAARRGAVHTFPYSDWQDYSTAADDRGTPSETDQNLGLGDAFNKDFQLSKRYGDVNYGVYWNIKLPVPGTVVAALDGTPTTAFTVGAETGIITFNSAPGSGVTVTAGCEFYVPVRFSNGVDELFQITAAEFNVGDVEELGMIEDLDPTPIDDEYDYGGAGEIAIPSGTSGLLGRMTTVTDDTGSIQLAAVANLPVGGPYACIYNADSGSVDVLDENGGSVGSVGTGAAKTLWLMLNGGNKAWLLV